MTARSSAVELYFSTCRCVMQAEPNERESWADLYRYLPLMRQAISCSVCGNIVLRPLRPPHRVCQHSICTGCFGGKFRLKPACSWCKDHDTFVENKQMRILILCFKKLCSYIYGSQIGTEIASNTSNGEKNRLDVLLREIINFEDEDYVSVTSVSQMTMPVLTRISEKCNRSSKTSSRNISSICTHEKSRTDPPTLQPVNMTSDDAVKSSMFTSTGVTNQYVPNIKQSEESSEPKSMSGTNHKQICTRIRPQNMNRRLPKKARIHRKQFIQKHLFSRKRKQKSQKLSYEEKFLSQLPTKRLRTETLAQPERKICKCARNKLPNILTCMGQRCPCYRNFMPCIGCLCRGCRNNRKVARDKSIAATNFQAENQFRFMNSSL